MKTKGKPQTRAKAHERLTITQTKALMKKLLVKYITKTHLANKMGVSWTAVHKYCTGEARAPKAYQKLL